MKNVTSMNQEITNNRSHTDLHHAFPNNQKLAFFKDQSISFSVDDVLNPDQHTNFDVSKDYSNSIYNDSPRNLSHSFVHDIELKINHPETVVNNMTSKYRLMSKFQTPTNIEQDRKYHKSSNTPYVIGQKLSRGIDVPNLTPAADIDQKLPPTEKYRTPVNSVRVSKEGILMADEPFDMYGYASYDGRNLPTSYDGRNLPTSRNPNLLTNAGKLEDVGKFSVPYTDSPTDEKPRLGQRNQQKMTGKWNQQKMTGKWNQQKMTGKWNQQEMTGKWNQQEITGKWNQQQVTDHEYFNEAKNDQIMKIFPLPPAKVVYLQNEGVRVACEVVAGMGGMPTISWRTVDGDRLVEVGTQIQIFIVENI